MASQPMLSTARLQLLPPEAPWARAVRDYQLRNRAHLAPWEPTRGDMYFTELFWGMRLREHIEEFRNGRGALFLVMHDKQPGQVIGTVHLSNIVRGAFLLQKLGFEVEGQAKDYLFLNGAWRDHVLTSLRNPAFDTNRMRS